MESKWMKSEPRESGFPGGLAGFQFSVANGYTQVWTDGACPNNGKGELGLGLVCSGVRGPS